MRLKPKVQGKYKMYKNYQWMCPSFGKVLLLLPFSFAPSPVPTPALTPVGLRKLLWSVCLASSCHSGA